MRALTVGAVVAVLGAAGEARADEARDTVYLEAFGKGGLWGVGFDHRLSPRLAAGLAVSATWVADERFLSFSPYVGATLARGGRHAWFAQLGPQLVHHAVESPIPEWDGAAHTGTAGQLTSGWQLGIADGLVMRLSVSVIAGQGGVAPWGGLALGWQP